MKKIFLVQSLFIAILFSFQAEASPSNVRHNLRNSNLTSSSLWLEEEANLSISRILNNISPSDARPGAVIAAQTRHEPNYYYHWVRDAALTMEAVISEYRTRTDANDRNILRQKLMEYLNFSEHIQNVSTLTGLGEPKFNVDGSAFNGPWGRPQNDGPALRAVSLIHWAQILIDEGQTDFIRDRLFDHKKSQVGVIKKDLDYVAVHWREPSFDLWEEVQGDHFYTRMVQRRAMVEGAQLALALGDSKSARIYSRQAIEIEQDLVNFWDPSRGYFIATRNQVAGLNYKHSQLDTAIILGLLHGSLNDGFLPFSDQKVQSTLDHLARAFTQVYKINHRSEIPGVAIGRYPEDQYGGNHFNGGNPWPLCTLALAEAYYRMGFDFSVRGRRLDSKSLLETGDQFVERVRYHAPANGLLNEQMDRNTGYMTSVEDLTWNYAAIISTLSARRTMIFRK